MAGNAGHPFFGNQYDKGGYNGGYRYEWKPNSNVATGLKCPTKAASDNIASVSLSAVLPQTTNKILPVASKVGNQGKGAIIAIVVVSLFAAIGTSVYYINKHSNGNRKLKEKGPQAIN